MASLIEQLTETKIRSLTKPGLHPDGRGLYLQVRERGTRSWIFRFSLNGRTRDMGLGALAEVSLSAARAKAASLRALRAQGIDPIEHAKKAHSASKIVIAESQGPTFREFAEQYIAAIERHWRNLKHRTQWRNTLATYAYPVIGDMPIAAIETPDILRVLEPIWETKNQTAMRLRGRMERIFARACVTGLRTSNPCLWRGHLIEALPKPSLIHSITHFAALPYAQIPTFMAELRALNNIGSQALRFLILTITRTNETVGARWNEIDRAARTWTIPAERMKKKIEHIVPLSDGALSILDEMWPLRDVANGFIFPGKQGQRLSHTALLDLVQRRMGRDVTVHGMRASFRDWAGEETDTDDQIAEFALAHRISDKTVAAYRRGTGFKKRIALMQEWSTYCGESRTNVVALRAAV